MQGEPEPLTSISVVPHNGWDDAMLHHLGDPKDYIDAAPKGYDD